MAVFRLPLPQATVRLAKILGSLVAVISISGWGQRMGIARRSFLQGASQLLALLAVSGLGRSPRAWAATGDASGSRKLALLIGLNRYPSGAFLRGSLTDVGCQQDLLVSRFGFAPEDIVTLTDGAATRESIETAFIDRLIAQATPNDRVLVHFSGYGRQVRVDELVQESLLVTPSSRDNGDRDVLLSTLQMLVQSLATPHVALVLDTSFSGSDRALLGNLRSRTFPGSQLETINGAELAFQESWRRDRIPATSSDTWQDALLLRATAPDRPAVEGDWGGFQAGLFTYALTQTLWQALPARQLWFDLALAGQQTAAWTGGQQQPQFDCWLADATETNSAEIREKAAGQPSSGQPSYGGKLLAMPATGRITAIERDSIAIRLTGLPLAVLRGYTPNSSLLVNSDASTEPSRLQIYAREGLNVRAKLTAGAMPTPGQTVREATRVLPYAPGLSVVLDPSFDRIERVDATSAFANISNIATPGTAGDGVADCVFGRAPNGGYSLQWPNGVAIPTTIGPTNEAIKSAVGRLSGYFSTLLAAKLWRMLANAGSTQLRVSAALETSYPETLLLRQQGMQELLTQDLSGASLARTTAGTEIHYRLENHSDRLLYFVILGLDAAGNAIAFYLPSPTVPCVASDSTRIVPEPAASYDWIVAGPAGIAETYLFLSTAPLQKTWEAIANTANVRGEGERVVSLTAPLAVAQALQEDLRAASAVSGEVFGYDPAVFALDVANWAAFDFVYQVEVA
ncbi:MAG: caspase family protein [Cyanobacteria bacterium J06641_5]